MTDPSVKSCAKGLWTKVATNVTACSVHDFQRKLNTGTEVAVFKHTYRDTGTAAPSDDSDAMLLDDESLYVSNSSAVDVYFKAVNKAGSVRVEL